MVKMQCNGITAKGGRCQRQVTYSGWNMGEDGGLYCSSHRVGYGYQMDNPEGPSLEEIKPDIFVGEPSAEEGKMFFSRVCMSLLIITVCVVIMEIFPSFLDIPLAFIALYHCLLLILLILNPRDMDPLRQVKFW